MATEETRERLLAAAGMIFGEKGFQEATVREICQAAEANLAAVNYYFGDKERLYIEAVKRAHCLRAEEVPLPAWTEGTTPQRKLYDFVLTILTRMVDDPRPPWHLQLMMRELLNPSAACGELVRDFIRPHFELVLRILDQLVPAETSEVERHLIVFSIIGQCLHYKIARPVVAVLVGDDELRSYSTLRLARHIAGFTLAALGHALPAEVAAEITAQPSSAASPVKAKSPKRAPAANKPAARSA